MKRSARRITVEPTQEELDLESDVQAYLRREYARSPAFGLVLVTFQKLLASSSRALALALERRALHLQEKEDEALELSDDLELAEELSGLITASSGLKSEGEIIELGLAEEPERWMDPLRPEEHGHSSVYQSANRYAHLYWLRKLGIEAWLVHLLFVEDPTFGRTSREIWEAAVPQIEDDLGLRGIRVPYATHVFLPGLDPDAALARELR